MRSVLRFFNSTVGSSPDKVGWKLTSHDFAQDKQTGMTLYSAKDGLRLPQSATNGVVAAVGLLSFLAAVACVRLARPFGNDLAPSAILIIGVTTAPIFLVDLGWQKIHFRPSPGLDFARHG